MLDETVFYSYGTIAALVEMRLRGSDFFFSSLLTTTSASTICLILVVKCRMMGFYLMAPLLEAGPWMKSASSLSKMVGPRTGIIRKISLVMLKWAGKLESLSTFWVSSLKLTTRMLDYFLSIYI
jgi:hypothetical protein